MEENRKNLRKHIRAASDWLQQADKSIEREEDLKGDLKLMLAKAELQNAEKHQNRSRLTKVLSFFTAALIALGILWINDKPEEISQLSTPSVSTTNVPDSPIQEEDKTSVVLPSLEIPVESTEETTTNQDVTQQQTDIEYEQPQIYENNESYNVNNEQPTFDSEPNAQAYYKSTEDLNIYHSEPISNMTEEANSRALAPTEDMQKLMQSAGQILHAE